MGKRSLRAAQLLAECREIANELTMLEMRDPAEPLEDIWRRLEAKTGVPFGTFWSLRWRHHQLKDIWGSIVDLLREARAVERERGHRAEEHRQFIQRVIGRSGRT